MRKSTDNIISKQNEKHPCSEKDFTQMKWTLLWIHYLYWECKKKKKKKKREKKVKEKKKLSGKNLYLLKGIVHYKRTPIVNVGSRSKCPPKGYMSVEWKIPTMGSKTWDNSVGATVLETIQLPTIYDMGYLQNLLKVSLKHMVCFA